jgi:uncharacterized membrane protein YdbT with pleckstrin-like domain
MKLAMERECRRYNLDPERIAASVRGEESLSPQSTGRKWWEFVIMAAAAAAFVWLATGAARQPVAMNLTWMMVLLGVTVCFLVVGGLLLWKRTRFS